MFGEVFRGAFDGLRGAGYLLTHPRLWKFVLLPLVIAIVILVFAVGWTLTALSGPIAALAAYLPGSWADNVLKLLAGVALTILSFAIMVSIASIIAGPFNEMLSETVEEIETSAPGEKFKLTTFLRDLVVGLWHSMRRVAVYLVVMVALLALGLVIPVVGSLVAAVLGYYVTARFASWDAYDAVWSRKRLRYREKVAYLREHRWRTLGLGGIVSIIVIVPGINVIGLAIGATGATLRSLDAERSRTRADS